MTTKTDEQERRDFEAWHERLYGRRPVLSIKYGGYQATAHQDRWRVWQARAALQEQTAMPADAEDTKRLDWLDSLNTKLNQHYGTTYCWSLVLSPNVVRLMSGRGGNGHVADIDLHDSAPHSQGAPSIREAIDARRRIKEES